jgi:prephenate dehydrogenase
VSGAVTSDAALHNQPWRVVAIAGVGLIGGSFGLALRKAGFEGRIIGVSSPRTVKAALERGAIHEALPLAEAAAQADVVFLAQPIETILETLGELDRHVRPGTLITDAGSTKAAIVQRAAEKIHNGRFVGGHPMAGKEARGVEAADADLFQGRPWVLTSPEAELETGELVKWIAKLGARLLILPAAEHDRLVGMVSHLPQLLSTALASTFAPEPDIARIAGPAAIDLTRLALSPYDIWRDILTTNTAEIDAALASFIARLTEIRANLTNHPSMAREFEQASEAARALRRMS